MILHLLEVLSRLIARFLLNKTTASLLSAAAIELSNFFLSPAFAIDDMIDQCAKEGQDAFEASINVLRDETFDLNEEDLHLVLDAFKVWTDEMEWSNQIVSIFQILVDPVDIDSATINMIDNHSKPTLAEITDFEVSCIRNNCRDAQDVRAAYRCLRLNIWGDDFTIRNKVSGNTFLKLIVQESRLGTNSTTACIRNCLSSLADYVVHIDDSIIIFNNCVKSLLRSLNERGETACNLKVIQLKGYAACKAKTLVKCIAEMAARDDNNKD